MSWVSIIVAGTSAAVGTYRYFHAKKQAQKNVRPDYMIDPIYQQNLNTLENTAGLPPSALEMYYRNAGQSGTAGINAINQGGGNGNLIAQLVNQQQRNYQDVLAQDALVQKQDIAGINNARLMLAEQNDKDFQLNQLNPYKDRAQAYAAEQAGAYAQIGNALNSASSSIANYKTGQLANQYNQGTQFDTAKMAALNGGNGSNTTTPNSGVNIYKLYQDLYGNQNQSPFVNQNNMTIGNIGQPQQQQNMFNPYNQNYFNQSSYFNPSMLSLYNNPYSF